MYQGGCLHTQYLPTGSPPWARLKYLKHCWMALCGICGCVTLQTIFIRHHQQVSDLIGPILWCSTKYHGCIKRVGRSAATQPSCQCVLVTTRYIATNKSPCGQKRVFPLRPSLYKSCVQKCWRDTLNCTGRHPWVLCPSLTIHTFPPVCALWVKANASNQHADVII